MRDQDAARVVQRDVDRRAREGDRSVEGAVLALHEEVFDHDSFTGRSGTFFAFEGLGSVYWHMVSKLLLAVAENFISAGENGADDKTVRRLGELYYRVRKGDTLHAIAFHFGQDWRDIAAWNGIRSPYTIYPDQKLKLSGPARRTASNTSSHSPSTFVP